MKKKGRSIKTILITTCVAVAVLPLLAVAFSAMGIVTSSLEEEITTKNMQLARSLAGEVEKFLEEPENILGQVGSLFQADVLNPEQFDEYLQTVTENFIFFEMIQVLDLQGRVVHLSPPDPELVGFDMSRQPFYEKSLEREGVFWSGTFISPQTGDPTLTVSQRLGQNMVVGYLNLAELNNIIARRVEVPDFFFVGITDSQGTFIGHTDSSLPMQRVNASDLQVVQRGLGGIEGNYRGPFQNQDILASVAITSQTGWPVVVTRFTEEAFAPVDRITRVFWFWGFVGFGLAIILAILNLRQFMVSFNTLAQKVKKVAGGDYQFELVQGSYREFNDLAGNIKVMSESIRARERALRESQDWLGTTLNSIGDAVIACDVGGYIKLMNPVAEKLTGWSNQEAKNQPMEKVFNIINEKTGEKIENPIKRVLSTQKIVGIDRLTMLITKEGRRIPIDDSAAPIKDEQGNIEGAVLVFRDVTEQKEMEEALMESKSKIEKLHDVAIKMERSQEEKEVYHLTVEAAEEILNFNICTLDIVEDGFFVPKATSSGVPVDGSATMPCDRGLGGQTYMEGKTIMVDDIQKAPGATPVKSKYRSAISLPIGDLGIFQVISEEVAVFGQEDKDLAELLISHTTEALKRIKSEKKIRYISFHDNLTNLYNRAYFEEELKRLDTQRQMPLSIVIGDANGLKLTNDVFGHQQGDRLLQAIAKILKETCRNEDIIARWGGDEFAILLPGTDNEEAKNICSRIKRACWESDHSPIQPSISLGVASKEDIREEVGEVLNRAENEMYANKLTESRDIRNSIIASLQRALAHHTYEDEKHVSRIRELVLAMGQELDLEKGELEKLELLADIHDIGKIAIPEDIIKKTTELTRKEWETVKRHPEIGFRIAESSQEFSAIADLILTHHECWNGGGYPQGLQGEDIPLLSRILAIVEAYEVMTCGRPYKEEMSCEEALAELEKNAGSQFDPELVEIFCGIIRKRNDNN